MFTSFAMLISNFSEKLITFPDVAEIVCSKKKEYIHLKIKNSNYYVLKTLDTIGNCQRPVFSLCVSQHMHKMTKQTCANLSSIGRRSCKISKEKNESNSCKITSFSKTTFTSEGAVSHNVLLYQPFPITCYQLC